MYYNNILVQYIIWSWGCIVFLGWCSGFLKRGKSLVLWWNILWARLPLREADPFQNGWIFGKSSKGGGGSFSIQKFMLQILGTLNKAFWAWNLYKRVISDYVFSTIVLILTDTIWPMPPCINATISIIKICIIIFQKWGGSQRLFGIFPKIHPFW